MIWSAERKREAAMRVRMNPGVLRPDSRVIERPGWYQIVTPSASGGLLNEVACSRVASRDAERVIDEVLATHAACGNAVRWWVGPWTRPSDFGERLLRRGFSCEQVHAMAIETPHVAASDGVAIEEVTPSDIAEYVTVALRGWSCPDDQIAAEITRHRVALSAKPRLAHYFAARIGGEIVGTASLALRSDHACLSGAQVRADVRGRGLYRALVAARLAFLARAGIELAVTLAHVDTSAPILAHLGFETLFSCQAFLLDPSAMLHRP